MFYHWEARKTAASFLREPVKQQWHDFSWGQAGLEARKIAAALQTLGVNAGERMEFGQWPGNPHSQD